MMGESTTVSAKISKELRQKLEKYHVQVSEVIRSALEQEIRKKEEENVAEHLKHASSILKKLPAGRAAEIIREDREER